MFTLACGIDIDAEIANALPFFFYWGVLFYGWTLIGGVISQVRAWTTGGGQPIRPLLYLLCAFGLMLPTQSLLTPLFVLGPFLLFGFGRVLRSREPLHGLQRQLTRAVVFAGVALVPLSYLRAIAQRNGLMDGVRYIDTDITSGLVVVSLAALFFALGWRLGHRDAPRRRSIVPVRASRTPRKVMLQPQQGCPLCWEVLTPADASDLAVCRDCRTVSHLSCAVEMGGCATLGCSRSRRGRRPRPRGGAATAASALAIQVRARTGRAVLAPAIA